MTNELDGEQGKKFILDQIDALPDLLSKQNPS